MRPSLTVPGLAALAAGLLILAGPVLAATGVGPDQASAAPILLAQGPTAPGPYRPTHPPDDPAYHGRGEAGKNPDGHNPGGHNPDGHGPGGHNPEGATRDLTVPGQDTTGVVSVPASPAAPSSPAAPAGYQGPDVGARSYRQYPEIRAGRYAPGLRSFRFDPRNRETRSLPPSPERYEEYQRYRQESLSAAASFLLLNPELGGSPLRSTTDVFIMNPDLRPD